jgi:hypothetical protein
MPPWLPTTGRNSLFARSTHGDKEEHRPQVWNRITKVSRAGDEGLQKRQAEIRQRTQGKEPQAGDRYRSIGSAQVRRQGAAATFWLGLGKEKELGQKEWRQEERHEEELGQEKHPLLHSKEDSLQEEFREKVIR